MKINILENKYKVTYVKDRSFMYNEENYGEVNYSDKTIKVAKGDDGEVFTDKWIYETLTHELAHAFMYETGNSDLNNERHAELLSKFACFVNDVINK